MYKLRNKESRRLFEEVINEEKIKKHLDALRNHHDETYRHSLRVGLLSIDLGYENKLPEKDIRLLAYASLLHDIGKLRISRKILSKPTSLNAEEAEIMKGHCRLGFLESKDIKSGAVRQIVASHHEFKPCPYPREKIDRRKFSRCKNERRREIILNLAQIAAVSDMYDALSRKRAYKPALKKEKVRRILKKYFTGSEKYLNQILER